MTTTHHQGPLALGQNATRPNTIIWTTSETNPPTTAVTLQNQHNDPRPVEAGHLCITANGTIYCCTNASNQAALMWGEITAEGSHPVVTDAPRFRSTITYEMVTNFFIDVKGRNPAIGDVITLTNNWTSADNYTMTLRYMQGTSPYSGQYLWAGIVAELNLIYTGLALSGTPTSGMQFQQMMTQDGVTGSFTSADGKTIMVSGGKIINIIEP